MENRHRLTQQGTAHGEMDASTEKGYSAAWVAEKVLEAVQNGQQEVLLFLFTSLEAMFQLFFGHVNPPFQGSFSLRWCWLPYTTG